MSSPQTHISSSTSGTPSQQEINELHRRVCEARWVLDNKPEKDQRDAWYARITDKRGDAAARTLVEDVNTERRRRFEEVIPPTDTKPIAARKQRDLLEAA